VALSGLLAACGSSDDGAAAAASGGAAGTGGLAGQGGGGGSAGTPATGGSAGKPATSGCGITSVPQSGKRTLSVGGTERTYYLHVPTGYDASKPWPLVVNFHGRTLGALGEASLLQENVSHLNAKGDAAGFVVVNPQGLTDSDTYQTWNAGLCCAEDENRDDVGFVDAMLDSLESELCVDAKRVYATGLSNGGIMSYRLACERADRFAAIAPVAGTNGMVPCSPSRPVSVIAFHGTADPIVSYGNFGKPSLEAWVTRIGCNPTPTETYNKGDSHCDTYSGCQGGTEAVLCTVDDGGHTWPGGLDLSAYGFGKTTQDISATDALWDFFVKHPLP
jgi:polyhydroxybutyrate depolymerase